MMTVTPQLRNSHEQFPIYRMYNIYIDISHARNYYVSVVYWCMHALHVHQCYHAVVRPSVRRMDGYTYKQMDTTIYTVSTLVHVFLFACCTHKFTNAMKRLI